MDISLSVPLDSGYLRRQCPACRRQFKWNSQAMDVLGGQDEAPAVCHCPYCGHAAATDAWATEQQVEYAASQATEMAARAVSDAFEDALSGGDGTIQFRASGQLTKPHFPPLAEPSDMQVVEPPCHPDQTIKVADDWVGVLHCLLCGAQFSI